MRWIVLAYKAPQQPSTARAAAWRLLKGAGALYLQQSVCLLPDLARTREVVARVQAFVEQAEGETVLLEITAMSESTEAQMHERFNALRDAECREVLERCAGFLEELRRESSVGKFTFAEVEENEDDLVKLRAWLRKIRARDFFGCRRVAEADAAVRKCAAQLEIFTERVLAHEAPAEAKVRRARVHR